MKNRCSPNPTKQKLIKIEKSTVDIAFWISQQVLMGIRFKNRFFVKKEKFSIIRIVFIKITGSKKSHWPG